MKHLEAILGQEKGGISQWAGDKGNVGINFTTPAKDAYQANIKTQLPNLAGEFDASIENASQPNAMVSLTAKTSTLTLTKAALESKLNHAPAQDASAKDKK